MRALQIDRYGGPDVIVARDIPIPKPASGDVLVQLAYAGINMMDILTRKGRYEGSHTYPVSLPTTLGMEGSGTIAALGDGVTEFAIGDRVAYCLSWGSYAEFAIVPAWRVAPVPDSVSLAQAAASMFQGSTAHYLANDLGRTEPGRTWLVHAASGGIGQALIQLGTRQGVDVYAMTSGDEKARAAMEQGAKAVFLYDDEGNYVDAVREATAGRGVDVVFDPLGKPSLRHSFRAAATRGLVVNFGGIAGAVEDLNPAELGEAGSLFLTRPRLADHLTDAAEVRRRARDVFAAIGDGTLTLAIGQTYGFDDVAEAQEALEARTIDGKPLLRIG